MKMNFDYFQIQKWKLQIVRAEKEKVDEKGVICPAFMFSLWVLVLKLSKKVFFWNFLADLGKKFKSVTTI